MDFINSKVTFQGWEIFAFICFWVVFIQFSFLCSPKIPVWGTLGKAARCFLQIFPPPMKHHAIKIWTGEVWITPMVQNSSNLLPFTSGNKTQLSQVLGKEQTSLVWLLLAMQLNPDAITKIRAPQGQTLSLWEYTSGIYKTQVGK